MALKVKLGVLAGLLSVCAMTGSGCGEKVTPKTETLAGAWIEVVKSDPGANPRIPRAAKPPSKIRRLTFEADQKFRFEICSPDGKPLAGQAFSGSWTEDGAFMMLTLSNVPEGDFASWAPVRSRGVTEISTSSGLVKRIRVTDAEDNTILYKPAE